MGLDEQLTRLLSLVGSVSLRVPLSGSDNCIRAVDYNSCQKDQEGAKRIGSV